MTVPQINKNIKQCRLKSGLTQNQVAEKLFVTRQTVSSYESGRTQPDLETLIKLSEILNVSINQLLYGEREREGRNRLNKAALIALICYLAALFVSGAVLCTINNWLLVPGAFEAGMSQITPQYEAIVSQRMGMLSVHSAIAEIACGIFDMALLVMVVMDLLIKPKSTYKEKLLYLLFIVAGSLLVTVPWKLLDAFYSVMDYVLISTSASISSIFLIAVDIIITAIMSRAAKNKPNR